MTETCILGSYSDRTALARGFRNQNTRAIRRASVCGKSAAISRGPSSPMTSDILENADRLISDARHLHEVGRSRSAATLIVVAIEQFGAFVEALAKEKFTDPVVHLGLFGDKANAHAKRQDALAAHVFNWTMGRLGDQFCWEIFIEKTGCRDTNQFLQWLKTAVPIEFKEEQKQRMRKDHELQMAGLLMRLTKENRLKDLREYGLYENSKSRFSDSAIKQVIELADVVRQILLKSREEITSQPMEVLDWNWLTGADRATMQG
jgi:hypothetical protein